MLRGVIVFAFYFYVVQGHARELTTNATYNGQVSKDALVDKLTNRALHTCLSQQTSLPGLIPTAFVPHSGIPDRRSPGPMHPATLGLAKTKGHAVVGRRPSFSTQASWEPGAEAENPKDKRRIWAEDIYPELVNSDVKTAYPEDVQPLREDEDAVLVDVRTVEQVEKDPIGEEGTIKLPYKLEGQADSLKGMLKSILLASVAASAQNTIPNPNFLTMAKEKLPSDKPIILVCNSGGVLEKPDWDGVNNPFANIKMYSRSLEAAHALDAAGFKNLYVMSDSINQFKFRRDMTLYLKNPGEFKKFIEKNRISEFEVLQFDDKSMSIEKQGRPSIVIDRAMLFRDARRKYPFEGKQNNGLYMVATFNYEDESFGLQFMSPVAKAIGLKR